MQNRIWLLPVTVPIWLQRLNKVACKPEQRRCQKSVLTALTCDYLSALVILAAAPAVKASALPSPALPASPASHA